MKRALSMNMLGANSFKFSVQVYKGLWLLGLQSYEGRQLVRHVALWMINLKISESNLIDHTEHLQGCVCVCLFPASL